MPRRYSAEEQRIKFPWRKGVLEGARSYPTKRKTPANIENGKKAAAKYASIAGSISRRVGVPNGQTQLSTDAARIHAQAEAKIILERMTDLGMVEKPTDTDTQKAQDALEYAIAVVRANIDSTADKLKAARLILDFTKSKPVQETKVQINTAEAFLKELLEADKK